MTENLVVFTALAAALMFAGEGTGTQARIGANLFFWARVVYWPGYVLGIPAVRITAWTIAVAGLVVMATALV